MTMTTGTSVEMMAAKSIAPMTDRPTMAKTRRATLRMGACAGSSVVSMTGGPTVTTTMRASSMFDRVHENGGLADDDGTVIVELGQCWSPACPWQSFVSWSFAVSWVEGSPREAGAR